MRQLLFKICSIGLLLLASISGSATSSVLLEDAEPEISTLDINGVMKYAMTQGLCQKVAKKKASDEEKVKLRDLFERMAELDPPKGSKESWSSFTTPLVDAANDIVDGNDAYKQLRKAANCTKCHRAHRTK